jgi:hypothetical protein
VNRDAAAALGRAAGRANVQGRFEPQAYPRVYERWHWVGLLGLVCFVVVLVVPARARPNKPSVAGKEIVQRKAVAGLDRVTRLEDMKLRDAERQRRLDALAEQAKSLQSALARGIEKREALARLAELQDHIRGERLSITDARNRPGLEAALGALESNQHMDRAAKALGDGDVSAFDREMQRLANLAEKDARSTAKQLLDKAADAASRRQARDLEKLLDEQRRLFEQREDRAELLRELGRLLEQDLDETARDALDRFAQTGDPEAQRALTEALVDAFGKLDEEQRRKLAERLKSMARDTRDLKPLTREQMKELASKLGTEEGQKQLAEHLKELAEQDASDAARGDEALDDGERGTGDAQRDIGGLVPVPAPSPNDGASPRNGAQQSGGQGGPHDTGSHEPRGKTEAVQSNSLRSKAQATLNPGVPMQGATAGRTAARAGETANQRGVGSLTAAGPEQLQAVERSEIPAEYREQVGRYFEPR